MGPDFTERPYSTIESEKVLQDNKGAPDGDKISSPEYEHKCLMIMMSSPDDNNE